MLNNITFFNSVEFPTTAFFPIIAFPLINAQCLISAFSSIITGPVILAVGDTLADFATHIFSPILLNTSLSKFGPSSNINSFISGNNSHGYFFLNNNSFAIVSFKL